MIGSVLQRELDGKKMSVPELSRQIGVSSQTIYSIIKRDNMKTDLETLLKICNALDVSIEIFYNDFVNTDSTTQILSKEEHSIILTYRMLNQTAKQKILEYVNDLEKSGLYSNTITTNQPNNIEVMKAACSEENMPRSIASITSDQLCKLKNAPSVYEDNPNE